MMNQSQSEYFAGTFIYEFSEKEVLSFLKSDSIGILDGPCV